MKQNASSFPKWKYRKHPTDGYFQSTLVASAEVEAELLAESADWSDDPASTGFEVRPATQMHHSHFTPHAAPLHEVLTEVVKDSKGRAVLKPLPAKIKIDLKGDKLNA